MIVRPQRNKLWLPGRDRNRRQSKRGNYLANPGRMLPRRRRDMVMEDTLMVSPDGNGLLVNEAGVLAVGQNCCECQDCEGCGCLRCCHEQVGTWEVTWSLEFSFGTLTGSAVNGDAGMTWSGGTCDDLLNCPDCAGYPRSCGGGGDPYTYVAACGGQYQSLVQSIKDFCEANSSALAVDVIADENCDPITPYSDTVNFPYDVIDWADAFWDDYLWQPIFALFCSDCFSGTLQSPRKIIGYAGITGAVIDYGPGGAGLGDCYVEHSETFNTPINGSCQYDYGTNEITYIGYTVTYSKTA